MIKLFLADCDGTLTDGIYHTTEDGKISKNFFTRDFHGMWMLNQAGIEVGIITVANDEVIVHQCNRGAKYVKVMKGIKDKLTFVADIFVEGDPYRIEHPHCKHKWDEIAFIGKYKWDEIAFIGDDVVDAGLLAAVGLAACPNDAVSGISDIVASRIIEASPGEGFACRFPGGRGCVREFAEYVLEINEGLKNND